MFAAHLGIHLVGCTLQVLSVGPNGGQPGRLAGCGFPYAPAALSDGNPFTCCACQHGVVVRDVLINTSHTLSSLPAETAVDTDSATTGNVQETT